ncbi:ImmA/IrrE family metallo-endopeptidase [Halalkalibacter sp. APA_J-10(15)]|uniref:ImmA/IrrE family metallo-endopeptidase n=1 Tax=Halalkalibacter sp. APA_J-10(15) TaxID=2933805 RepID=UPI001FF21F03|nr:ImmA/IrrE family metallo-endopeptidase [Halalkalibacter sp. APA_J-10(15)]MCK0470408.1 ImmA/IrrE family metallo-endopeptidase [Halalkalibacter sp. APA_J-10(15)]
MIAYQTTHLEDTIEKLYNQLGINSPDNFNMDEIALILGISLHFQAFNSQLVTFRGKTSININSEQSPQEMWEDFGHELCHYLIQYGKQTHMAELFLKFQEYKADHFALHFCVPTFMLEQVELPAERNQAIALIAAKFNVTIPFAKKRLERYEQQLIGSEINLRFIAQFEAMNLFKQQIGHDYVLEDSNNTYLVKRHRIK